MCSLQLARTYGLIGLVRICTQEHLVLESKPDNVRPDWRLAKPFKEMAVRLSTALTCQWRRARVAHTRMSHCLYPGIRGRV